MLACGIGRDARKAACHGRSESHAWHGWGPELENEGRLEAVLHRLHVPPACIVAGADHTQSVAA